MYYIITKLNSVIKNGKFICSNISRKSPESQKKIKTSATFSRNCANMKIFNI